MLLLGDIIIIDLESIGKVIGQIIVMLGVIFVIGWAWGVVSKWFNN